LLAPPLTKHYILVGTAFDYLLRFYVERLNPNAITRRWVAELAISHPLSPILADVTVYMDGTISFRETPLTRKVEQMIQQGKKAHTEYIASGVLTVELIKSCLLLAQSDQIFRGGKIGARIVDETLRIVQEEDIADLWNLISIVDPNIFRARELCLLNPTFGEGSNLVGGADADLVIDDTIIEIKTTKNLKLRRAYFDQLLGYYILHEISGVGGLQPKPKISKVAIYFSRFAHLYVIDLQDIIDPRTFPDFVRWFKERASEREFAA